MLCDGFVWWLSILLCVFFRIEALGVVQYAYRKLGIILLEQHAYLDLRRGDRLDVDAAFAQRLEHRRGDTGVAAHADADHRDLGDAGVVLEIDEADPLARGIEHLDRAREIGGRQDRKSTRLDSSH